MIIDLFGWCCEKKGDFFCKFENVFDLAGDMGMSKEAAAASRGQGRKRWQKPVSNQMQMKGEESRPSGG